MSPLEITLVILLVTIIAFVSGKVPFSVISTGIILALILTGIKTPAEAFGGFINTNVVMFVAMFVIGAGLTKTPLIDKAQSLVIRYKDNMRMLIFLSCVAGAFLGAITSATYQLLQSDGDFKSVQGNTGHATASVLMDTYAHTQDKPRLELTEKIEANFYSQDLTPAAPQPQQNEKPAATKISGKEILEAIRLMDADERRELTRALFA